MNKSKKSKKAGFTLAEVLITLGIIGVVVALTLPTLIQQHQKQVYVTQLKKAVNTWDNMMKKMQADEGVTEMNNTELFSKAICNDYSCDWFSNSDYNYVNFSNLEEIIPKYLKTTKICKLGECKTTYISSKNYKTTNGNVNCNIYKDFDKLIGFYSTDGTIYYIGTGGFGGLFVAIDVNGDKQPNTVGRDLFSFYIYGYHNGRLEAEDSCSQKVITNSWKMDY